MRDSEVGVPSMSSSPPSHDATHAGRKQEQPTPLVQDPNAPYPANGAPQKQLHRGLLYAPHALCSWSERMWEYSVVVYLTIVHPGIALVSSYGLTICLTATLLSGPLGSWLDGTPRLQALRTVSVVRNAAIAACALCMCALTAEREMQRAHRVALLVAVHVLGAVAGLGSRTQVIALEQDWVVVLSRGDARWLGRTNAVLRRLDLTCDMLAPAAVGVLITVAPLQTAALSVAACNLVSVCVEFAAMTAMFVLEPALATKGHVHAAETADGSSINALDDVPGSTSQGLGLLVRRRHALEMLSIYFSQPIAPACVALAMLYLTVLCFGSVMIGWLRLEGVPDSALGVARACSAFTGLLGTLLYPVLVGRLGLVRSGLCAIWVQVFFLGVGCIGMWLLPQGQAQAGALVAGVVLSRVGLWSFDLVMSQVIQESVPELQRGVVNGVQQGLQAALEMTSYVMALVLRHPGQFGALVAGSLSVVIAAALIYTRFATHGGAAAAAAGGALLPLRSRSSAAVPASRTPLRDASESAGEQARLLADYGSGGCAVAAVTGGETAVGDSNGIQARAPEQKMRSKRGGQRVTAKREPVLSLQETDDAEHAAVALSAG